MKNIFAILALAVAVLATPAISEAQVSFNMFQNAETSIHSGEIDLRPTGSGGDTIMCALSNTAPTASWTQFSSVTEISAGNGYTAGGAAMATDSLSQTGGVMTWVGANVQWTASGGSIGPARYFILYDDTHASDLLIGWFDYGSSFTVADGQPLTLTLTTLLTITTAELYLPNLQIELGAVFQVAMIPRKAFTGVVTG